MSKRRTYRVVRAPEVESLESEINSKYLADPEIYNDLQFHGGMGMEMSSIGGVYRYHQTISFINLNLTNYGK